jgi:hypothetical protein
MVQKVLFLLVEAKKAYKRFLVLLEEEFEAAAGYHLEVFERLGREKEDLYLTIQDTLRELFSLKAGVSLKTFKELELFIQDLPQKEELEIHLRGLSSLMRESIPAVKRNETILGRLLENNQENFLFWKKILSELGSSYTETGHLASHGVNSHFSVKA